MECNLTSVPRGVALFSTEPWPDWGTNPNDDKRFIPVYVSARTGTRGILALLVGVVESAPPPSWVLGGFPGNPGNH